MGSKQRTNKVKKKITQKYFLNVLNLFSITFPSHPQKNFKLEKLVVKTCRFLAFPYLLVEAFNHALHELNQIFH